MDKRYIKRYQIILNGRRWYVIKVKRTEQQFIKRGHPLFEIVDKYCFYSKNVYNEANYLMRQEFVKNKHVLNAYDIQKLMQNMDCYKECGSQAA